MQRDDAEEYASCSAVLIASASDDLFTKKSKSSHRLVTGLEIRKDLKECFAFVSFGQLPYQKKRQTRKYLLKGTTETNSTCVSRADNVMREMQQAEIT